ncbi:MAG TPA: hypothetical protein VLD65_01600 [Anaerolineales bacterium]|nr:hypothetical protein [Anaerolineales bacterium]
MYTPPSKKNIFRLAIVWIAAIIILALLYGIFLSPLSPFRQCTLIGCRDTLEISLAHEPPGQYSLVLTSSMGDIRRVVCLPGEISAVDDMSALCRAGIVTIYAFTPPDVTINISWSGGSYSTSAQPTYETIHPNGSSCPPACQIGKLSIALP